MARQAPRPVWGLADPCYRSARFHCPCPVSASAATDITPAGRAEWWERFWKFGVRGAHLRNRVVIPPMSEPAAQSTTNGETTPPHGQPTAHPRNRSKSWRPKRRCRIMIPEPIHPKEIQPRRHVHSHNAVDSLSTSRRKNGKPNDDDAHEPQASGDRDNAARLFDLPRRAAALRPRPPDMIAA